MRIRRWITLSLLLLVLPWRAQATVSLQYSIGSSTTLLSTDLNSIANNAYSAASAVYDNTLAATGNGATLCRFELLVVFASSPTANTSVTVWLTRAYDGTNYEPTPTSSIGPGAALQLSFPVNSGQTTTRAVIDTPCPAGKFKATVKNEGTGQAFAASGNTLKVTPITLQGN